MNSEWFSWHCPSTLGKTKIWKWTCRCCECHFKIQEQPFLSSQQFHRKSGWRYWMSPSCLPHWRPMMLASESRLVPGDSQIPHDQRNRVWFQCLCDNFRIFDIAVLVQCACFICTKWRSDWSPFAFAHWSVHVSNCLLWKREKHLWTPWIFYPNLVGEARENGGLCAHDWNGYEMPKPIGDQSLLYTDAGIMRLVALWLKWSSIRANVESPQMNWIATCATCGWEDHVKGLINKPNR